MIRQISAKIGNMRKAADFIVYPAADGQTDLTIQSDTRIARFDIATGRGLVSKARSNGAYFMHLLPTFGASAFVADAGLIAAALDAQPHSGDEIGPGVRIL